MKHESIYQKPVTWVGILAFTLPTIFMTLIQASYSMIDGIFVSNILGDEALSSLTLISPYFNFFIAVGAMFASGGSAVVMKKMGEGREREARSDFSTLTLIAALVGLLFGTVFLLFTKPLVDAFGAEPHVTALCREYLFAYSFFIIPQILFAVLQVYTIGSGRTGMAVGSSLIGGVAASTITFYVFGLMSALYMGYMLGVSPLLSYFYGAGRTEKLKKIRNISVAFISILAVTTTLLSVFGSELLVSAFTRPGSEAYGLAINGNRLFSMALLFVGFNTFSSMLFTALSNGKVSAMIAFSRTFVFLIAAILLLPLALGINGLWLSVPVSELLALTLSGFFIKKYQKTYHY